MKNGEVIDLYEDYNIPVNEGIVGDFKRGKKKFLEFGDRLFCFYTIPFDQISFIAMTDVKKVVLSKAAEMLPIHDTGLCPIYTITKGR